MGLVRLLLTFTLLTPTALFAATRFVAVGGADTGDCTITACATLTYAIAQAAANDTIDVGPGTFNNGGNPVTVDKTLTLRGEQFGVDARNRAATETVLTVAVTLAANNLVFDGFQCNGGISVGKSSGNIRNNILTASGGLHLPMRFSSIYPGQVVVQFNWFAGIEGISGDGVNVTIDQNLFTNQKFTDIFTYFDDHLIISNNRMMNGGGYWGSVIVSGSNIEISGNVITGGLGGINISGVVNANVHANTVDGVTYAAMLFQGVPQSTFSTNTGVNVTGNQFLNSGTGVRFSDMTQVEGWQLHFNRIVGNTVDVDVPYYPKTANLENNWWGCNEGPATCATVSNFTALLDLDPWLVMDIAATPTTIGLAGASTVTSDFNQNSNGAAVSGFPSGVNVTFAATSGAMTPPTAPTSGGAATSTFHPAALGTATISATLDEETVSTSVIVLATTTVALTSNQNPNGLGLPVTFTATVDPAATGTITFFDGATALGTVPIGGGSAQFTTTLVAGTHTITARYSGDANFLPATSPPLLQAVNAVPVPTLSATMLMLLAIGVALAAWIALRSSS